MSTQSKIEWTQTTWNPVSGCRKVSAGCDHCYAIKEAHRLSGNPHPAVAAAYAGLTTVQNGRLNWTGTFRELPERLEEPLRWTKPRRVFVNSMSDLFGEGISDDYLDRVFAVMALAREHQFQVLTKRPERMRAYIGSGSGRQEQVHRAYRELAGERWDALPVLLRSKIVNDNLGWRPHFTWPLENVWLGTSVEDQRAADTRIPALLATPTAVRFLSCEPLLGPVDLKPFLCAFCGGSGLVSPHEWTRPCPRCRGSHYASSQYPGQDLPRLHWVITGGESGPQARPLALSWLRSLQDQCRHARIAFFVKQLGSIWSRQAGAASPKGGDPEEWPSDLRIREFPEA